MCGRGCRVAGGQRQRRCASAYARSAAGGFRQSPRLWNHPRSRGEHRRRPIRRRRIGGSSPLTRGARHHDHRRRAGRGIIPAHAGSTLWRRPRAPGRPDHPSSRGEHEVMASDTAASVGSSPLTRGAHGRSGCVGVGRGIIPAHAGSTRPLWVCRRGTWDHPRSRGEHGSPFRPARQRYGSSPLTRGARSDPDLRTLTRGIIPAHAGSTSAPWSRGSRRRDHPRSRGEHKHQWPGAADAPGSSPLTRGARRTPHPKFP